jgi:hypothetical protein
MTDPPTVADPTSDPATPDPATPDRPTPRDIAQHAAQVLRDHADICSRAGQSAVLLAEADAIEQALTTASDIPDDLPVLAPGEPFPPAGRGPQEEA